MKLGEQWGPMWKKLGDDERDGKKGWALSNRGKPKVLVKLGLLPKTKFYLTFGLAGIYWVRPKSCTNQKKDSVVFWANAVLSAFLRGQNRASPCSEEEYVGGNSFATLLYSTLFYSTLLYSTLLFPPVLCSALLYSTLLYSSLLYSTLLYSTLRFATLLFPLLLYVTLRSATLYSTLLHSTLRYPTL